MDHPVSLLRKLLIFTATLLVLLIAQPPAIAFGSSTSPQTTLVKEEPECNHAVFPLFQYVTEDSDLSCSAPIIPDRVFKENNLYPSQPDGTLFITRIAYLHLKLPDSKY